MIEDTGARTGRSTCGGSVPLTSASFSETSWRAMKMSAPQSNSTQTTAMPDRGGRPDASHPGRTVDRALQRKRHERFHLLRGHAVTLGENRHRRCGEVGKHIDRHLASGPTAGAQQEQREPDDHPAVVDRPLNKRFIVYSGGPCPPDALRGDPVARAPRRITQ